MTEKAGLAWGKGQKPNPPPSWCTKPRPCDFDKGSFYCPHRECRHKLLDEHDVMRQTLARMGVVTMPYVPSETTGPTDPNQR